VSKAVKNQVKVAVGALTTFMGEMTGMFAVDPAVDAVMQ
jgi:hypothetical protein